VARLVPKTLSSTRLNGLPSLSAFPHANFGQFLATMSYEQREAYWEDREAKDAFIDFIREIHGFDFRLWDSLGYWRDLYRPFSLFEDGKVIASVCLYTMPAVVNGRACRVAQISGVGTLPAYRRRGLNRELTNRALEWAKGSHEFTFLFADEEAFEYYRRCGFRRVPDYAERATFSGIQPKPGLIKIDPLEDPAGREALFAAACHRAPVSNRFANFNPELVMFHVVYLLRHSLYRIPDLDAFVLMRRRGARVTLYDVIAREMPTLAALAPYLSDQSEMEFEARFYMDKLGVADPAHEQLPDSSAHLLGSCPLEPTIVFPHTIHA
jgi:GNAT superfamily N-acetyltransferase